MAAQSLRMLANVVSFRTRFGRWQDVIGGATAVVLSFGALLMLTHWCYKRVADVVVDDGIVVVSVASSRACAWTG